MYAMIIIGEKINGFIPKTLAAIEAKDEGYIRQIALEQQEGGAAYLDICAGTAPEIERETLEWLIDIVLDETQTPLCLDSSDPQMLLDMFAYVQGKAAGMAEAAGTAEAAGKQASDGIINSVSLERVGDSGLTKCDLVYPAIASSNWGVIALTCDNTGIPDDPKVKFELASKMIDQAAAAGIAQDRVYIDPLVTTLGANPESLISFNEGVRLIKEAYPQVHFTSGLSNISFGLPFRKAINMQFLCLAMAAGMDSAIMDPTSADMLATLYATDALLGNDEFCMEYLGAYRAGLFGAK